MDVFYANDLTKGMNEMTFRKGFVSF